MEDSFDCLHYHLVFSTKHRFPWIKIDEQERCWGYMGGILRNLGVTALQIGGMEDHVHLLLGIPPTLKIVDVIRSLKGRSTPWIRNNLADCAEFSWQDGYAIFSVSQSNLEEVLCYIMNQRRHHLKGNYDREILMLVRLHKPHLEIETVEISRGLTDSLEGRGSPRHL